MRYLKYNLKNSVDESDILKRNNLTLGQKTLNLKTKIASKIRQFDFATPVCENLVSLWRAHLTVLPLSTESLKVTNEREKKVLIDIYLAYKIEHHNYTGLEIGDLSAIGK